MTALRPMFASPFRSRRLQQAGTILGRPYLPTRHVTTTRLAQQSAAHAAFTPSRNDPVLPAEEPSNLPRPPPLAPSRRQSTLKDARPFSDFLTDTFHRQHDYLRISVTERCNLRCLYCMPEEGIELSPSEKLLTTPEIVLLSSLFVSQGVTKIRLTGGEPTVRRDIVPLIQHIGALRAHGLRQLCLTTNGLSLHRKLEPMVEAGLTGVNLSLDTLDPWQFQIMTRRNGFAAVQKSIDRIYELNRAGAGIKFKINCVVMRGMNDREIVPFVEMTREKDVEVRFIEYMPFDGNKWSQGKMFSYEEMLGLIREKYPGLHKVQDHKNETSKTFQIPGFAGRIGFITSMTHNFCGSCNRLRITSDGNLKVCLFGNDEVSLRDIIRKINNGEPIETEVFEAMKQIAMDESKHLPPSERPPMLAPNSPELLEIIGMAVKRKKEKHADLGDLEHMLNRPMILIDSRSKPPKYHNMGHMYTPVPSTPWLQGLRVPVSMLSMPTPTFQQTRLFTGSSRRLKDNTYSPKPKLTHVSDSGSAHMVSISDKTPTKRLATAKCTVRFSNPIAIELIQQNQMKKGDVLGVARVAGIMASKRTPDLIPLCHPIAISHVSVEADVAEGASIEITATVSCDGKTGVEMEALTAASTAALTVYDMCKAVDKGMVIEGLRVVLKEGGKSGRWVEGMNTD
ncbi:molybdenum cofactor biosynthesis protein 1 B [Coniochaeta sp. 2T2.1]|nr:molybdenum cofactor biosynthesis protein 1 B [Coniochaeta sp. 2T2.1]